MRTGKGKITVWFALLVIVAMLSQGCGSNTITGKNPGVLRDEIFSVEPRANGTTSIWMVHDDLATYCTADPDIVRTINSIFYSANPTAWVGYRTMQMGDPDCGQEGSSKNGFKTYLIVSITNTPPQR